MNRIHWSRNAVMSTAMVLLVATAIACDDDDKDGGEQDAGAACIPGDPDTCPEGAICETTTFGDGQPGCFAPVVVRGRVFDLLTDEGVEDALVIARDANGAALGSVGVTDGDGNYDIIVPVPRHDEQGGVSGTVLTLRVDAAGYLSYPGGFRPSLPVALDAAEPADLDGEEGPEELVVQTPTTDVALMPVKENPDDQGAISGQAPGGFGALIVADGPEVTTGVADAAGHYTIFNVAPGSYTLRAYAAGLQFDPTSADVEAGAETEDVDFTPGDGALATVTGSVNIVNAPGGSLTSVVLVVEETFDENFARGEVPPGLRAGEVGGDFSIEGVPDGRYVVLAAFENDDLVRDPDTTIGGTHIIHVQTSGGTEKIPESFKVTEALALKGPGAEEPEAVTGTPTFSWADDSSEDNYRVVVYDAFGQLVWEDDSLDGVSGQEWVTHQYGGPALEPGLYYQWRATSSKKGTPISTTEDLRGLFYIAE